MVGYYANIEELTLKNTFFRKVLYTTKQMQLVLMSLKPGEDIGMEVHPDNDQFFRFESGTGKVVINDQEYSVKDGDTVVVPKGSRHDVINTGEGELKMYTIYAPSHHPDGTIRKQKKKQWKQKNTSIKIGSCFKTP